MRLMRWSSRVGDLAFSLVVSGPPDPALPVQRPSGHLSGSDPYTTRWDVNAPEFGRSLCVCAALPQVSEPGWVRT